MVSPDGQAFMFTSDEDTDRVPTSVIEAMPVAHREAQRTGHAALPAAAAA
jgi:hypothetical protein